MSDVLQQMREMLARHARSPFGLPDCLDFFAERPRDANELLNQLFAEYDDGDPVEPDIRALIRLLRDARKYVSVKRSEALKRMDVIRSAYWYPPTCQRLLYLGLRGVVHAGEPSGIVENLVSEYPCVAQSLLEQLVREQRHDKFYEVAPTGWLDTTADIAALRSMIARSEGRRLLDEMGGV